MASRGVVLLLVLATAVFAEHEADILNLYKHTFHGDGTYYGNVQGGMCQLNTPDLPPVAKNPKIKHLVALNAQQMFNTLGCGMCFKVHATGQGSGNDPITGDFIVYVKDVCPECLKGSLDLASNGDGRWSISMQAVQCPVGNGHIEYKFQGSNPWYIKMQVRNERMPATKVEVYQTKSNQWLPLKRSLDGFWLFNTNYNFEKPVHLPMAIRLTAANGEQIRDSIPSIANDRVIHGSGVQFSLDASLPHA